MQSEDTKKIRNKIRTIFNNILERLPGQHACDLIIYNTVYDMLRAEGKETGMTYSEIVEYYIDYLIKYDETYIKTKYCEFSKIKNRKNVFKILAFSGNPIGAAVDTLAHGTDCGIAFVLLHEIGHNYHMRKSNDLSETLADKFAIRWIRKFIKDDLIEAPKDKGKDI